MTYSTLTVSTKGRSRLQQLVAWLGGAAWDGVLVFDECHKAKNFSLEGGGTKVAAAVIELQRLLPMARVLYCSATGVSEVRVVKRRLHSSSRRGQDVVSTFRLFTHSLCRWPTWPICRGWICGARGAPSRTLTHSWRA